MASPTRSGLSPTAARLTTSIPNTTVISPRSISSRSQLEESISTLQNEQERVQKKTFTKWVNIYLSLHEPPYFVNDLFEDFQDGTKLIALLEVLSGQTFPVERGKKRAHCLSNVDNALKYLESRKIKLVNIRPIDIVDGKPMMILGLVWMLILCYQIEDSNMFDEDSKDTRSKAKEALLEWVRKKTSGQLDGLDIRDFTTSWRDGLAFNALIHALRPDVIDLRRVTRMDARERLEHAFNIAEQHLGIPRLIDAEDVDVKKPDEKSIMTYVAQFSRRFPDLPFGSINKEHGELLRWLADTRQRLMLVIEAPIKDIQVEYKEYVKQAKDFVEKQKQWKAFERKESKSPHFPGEKLKELKEAFDDIAHRMNRWRYKLDTNLPGELGQIADWINTAETILSRGINFDPLTLSPEENVQRFTKLNEEHAAIFTDKEVILSTFQRLKRDQSIINKQISLEHLTNLNERLEILMNTSEERGRYLDFEQIHWQVQVYFVQLEYFILVLNKKQGDLYQTEKLYNEYKRKIHDEKLLAHIESLLPELTRKAQSYGSLGKKDDNISRSFLTYCENIRKTIRSVTIDLQTKEHMLQETITSWKTYHNLYDSLEKWLNDGEQILRRSSEEKFNYFLDVENWSQIHDKLRLAIEHLISVCEDDHVTILKNKLLFINRRWKEVIESVQQFKHDESIKKKRDEFYSGRAKLLDTLDKIDREMQDYLPCTTRALKEQENRLYDAQAELDMFNQTVQVLSKLSQTIARESGESNASTEMNSLLQICFDKLHHIQEYLPLILKRNKIMLGHLQKFEDGLQKCQQWFNEAKQLFNRYSIQVPVKRIEDSLEQHRSFFADIGYYQSLLDNKSKLIITMKKANENLVPLNFSPVDEQYKQLLDTFEQICQQASYWEKEFSQHSTLWKDFHQRLRYLQEWIDQAQNIVCEKHDDYAYLIQKHKNFFQLIDDEIFHGFIKSGRELLHIRDKIDQKEIQILIDSLETKWNTIIAYAPIRLLRLQYERIENIIVKELKQAEDELNNELKQLERERDTTDILRRHNEHFQVNNFQPTMDTYMKNLQSYANDIRLKNTDSTYEIEQIDQRTIKLNDYWTRMQAKIDNVKRKLQTIPKKWQDFEEKFHIVETWMSTIERSMNDTQNTEVSFDQYKILVNKFKTDVQQIDSIAQEVKILTNLLDDLIEERATDEPSRHRQRLDTLLSRYRQLLKSIDETSQYCSVLIPSKMIHENSLQLNNSLLNISNAPIHFRDINDVRLALQGQIKVCEVLENLAPQINELITRGNELIRQPSVPKYVAQDVQNIQKFYHEKVLTAQDFLANLKKLVDLWERFDANKHRYQQQIERLNNELGQLMTNRSSISSFQHEIDNGKHLRTAYADLKTILDENAQYLQTMSANHLIPYENLQNLKGEHDSMIEDLIEKLREIDEYLQDLIDNNKHWSNFHDELKRLEIVFHEINSMFDAKMFGERTLEEKQEILEKIRTELGEHLHSLSILHSNRSNIENVRYQPKDLVQLLTRLNQLNALADLTSKKINREEEQLSICRTHVQTSQRFIDQLRPWIEQAETYLNKRIDQHGALNLMDAKQLYEKHKDFLEERRRMSSIYNNLVSEETNIVDQYELKSLIKSLSLRWNDILRKSDELTPRYDKQYSSWLVFESELNSFRDQILIDIEQRVQSTVSIDINRLFDLTKITNLLTELRTLDEHIHAHTSNYNRFHKQLTDLRQYTTIEGQRILHEEQISIETRWHRINRLTTDKLRELERFYESRKSLHNRFEIFERSIRDLAEQIDNQSQIHTSTLVESLDRLQQIQKQLQTIQPLMSTIEQEFSELDTDLQSTFESHRQRIHTYETIVDKRFDLLKRYDSHMKQSTEIRRQLQDIHDHIQQKQHMKIADIDQLKAQLDQYRNDLHILQNESILLDRLMEESHTTIVDSLTNRNLFFTVESRTIQNLVDTIENKLIQRRIQTEELDRLIDDFTQSHTNLLHRIHSLSSNLRTARLLGYSPREIDDLMIIVKTLNREIENENIQYNLLVGKYKILTSNLSNQDRQQADIVMNKIEIELKQLQEQIDKRQDRLTNLLQQRQQFDQLIDRFNFWYDEKQRLLTTNQTIPLKIIEIERIQKKYIETINELKSQRTILDTIIQLHDNVKQGYIYENQMDYDCHTDELLHKLNHFEENLIEQNQQLTLAIEQRREFEQIITQLNDWMKTIEQQIQDPFTNELQQPANILREKSKTIQSLLQSTKDRLKDFDDLTRISDRISSTLNDTDRIIFEEKYSLIKDKYNRLLDNLTQRIVLLDEAIHERTQFDNQTEHVKQLYDKLENDYTQFKQRTLSDSNDRQFEHYKQLLKTFNETSNQFKEFTRLQHLLNSKGYRIDFRFANEFNFNLKTFDDLIQNEFERIERTRQTLNDFNQFEKDLDSYLNLSTEQLNLSQNYQTIADRLQQAEHELNKLIHLNERLVNDIPHTQYEQFKRTIDNQQQRLNHLNKTCQQIRIEHEHRIKTQQKLTDDLISTNDWFRKLIVDLNQPLDLNLSLNNINDLQESLKQLTATVNQRLARIDQILHDEPNLIDSNDDELRERLDILEQLKHQVQTHLNKHRHTLEDIHQRMIEYLQLTTEIKSTICDIDFKLAPFFDGYDCHHFDEHEKEFKSLENLCTKQSERLVQAHEFVEYFRDYLKINAKDLCDKQLKAFHQSIEDLEARIVQRRKELDEIHQKFIRFNTNLSHLRAETDRFLHLIDRSSDAEDLINELETNFTDLQYLGRDLKKSLDVNSSTEIDRELKQVALAIENVRENLERTKKIQEENELLHERIERTLSKIQSFINRKHQDIDGNLDLLRQSIELKTFIRDIDFEYTHLNEITDLISILIERKYDQQYIRSLETKQDNLKTDLQTLKNQTIKTIENLEYQIQEQDKLRQNTRTMLAIVQRTKAQLIELRPSINNESDQKLKKINEELTKNFQQFKQSIEIYQTKYNNVFADDLNKTIDRIYENVDELKIRLNEKLIEFNEFTKVKNEYETIIENLMKILQTIDMKIRQKTFNSFKELTIEMQTHRSSLDRCQHLASTLISHINDANERDHIRRRLNELTHRWTEFEQNLLIEEEEFTEFNQFNQQYNEFHSSSDRWIKQTKDLQIELTNAKTIDNLEQTLAKTRLHLSDYQIHFEHFQRLKIRLNRLNQSSEINQKLNDIDRISQDLIKHRDQLEQRLDLSQKIYLQLNEYQRQYQFYEQWIDNLQRTIENILEDKSSIDDKLQRLNDIQIELDKRKQILVHLEHDYPQISQLISTSTQKLIGNIDKIKGNIRKKLEEFEQYNRQQKDYRTRIDTIFEWIKQTQRYEPISDKRELDSYQREQTKLKDKQQQIQEKSKEIDQLLRTINNSKLPSDYLQKLRQEIDHLRERLAESSTELDTRNKFLTKSIHDLKKQRNYLVEHDLQAPDRSIEDALKSLDSQMTKIEMENLEREKRKRQHEREWRLFFEQINLLQEKLNSFKQRKLNQQNSIEEQLHSIEKQYQELTQYQEELVHLKKHAQQLCIESENTIPLPSDIHLVQSIITFLQQQLNQRRELLRVSAHNRDMYLNECKLYEDAYSLSMERLSRSLPMTSTSDEYARQIVECKHHREQINDKYRQITKLFDKLDRSTSLHLSRQNHDLEKRSNDLQEKYFEQIHRSEYCLRIWKEYEIRLEDFHRQFDDIEKQISSPSKHLISFAQIQSTYHLYKDSKQKLLSIESELNQFNDDIQKLSQNFHISTLQTNLQHIKETFIRISNDIRDKFECHKNATILANDIKRNLAILDETFGQCSNQTLTDKNQLERLMDIEKRLDNLVDVYSSTVALVKRLSSYKLYDIQSIENDLDNFYRKWTNLKNDIIQQENILHKNFINNLPTRQACKEIDLFIEKIKRLLDDDHGAPINNRKTLEKLLKRYRDMRVDVLNHQRIVDFLNESFQQEANIDSTSFDYMENIKQINIDWIRIKSLISARIDTLEQLNEQFNEFDQTIRTLSDWVQEQTSDLEFLKTKKFESDAKNNLRKCTELEYQITTKQQILTSLKSFNHRMTSSTTTFRINDQDGTIQTVRHMLDQLSPSIEQLKCQSKTILTNWQDFNRILLQIDKLLYEAEIEIDRIETSAINVETYEMSTRKAQEYLQAMESHRQQFDQINTHNRLFSDQCDTQISSKINEITRRIQQQWSIIERKLQDIVKTSKEIVDHWRQFNSSYVHLLDRLGELENRWYTIQDEKFTSNIDSLLEKAKDFQQRLQQLDIEIVQLENHSKILIQHLPSIAAKKIDTQYSVIKNQYTQLKTFQNKLLIDSNELKQREKIYLEYFNELTQIITHAQTILKSQHLNNENESKTLKQLQTNFQSKSHLIERLNSNEFSLFIKRDKHLHDLIVEYSNCFDEIKVRLKQIEINEYNQLNFDKRCQKWNDYIQAIEQNLMIIERNLPTNYHGLIEIEKNLSNTINDFNQRQYEFMQLINQGKEKISIQLEQRWQNIMNICLKKQEDIKGLIKIWLSYQNYLDSYYRLLRGKQEKLQLISISHSTTIDNDDMKNLLEKIYETNRQLLKHSDIKTQTILENEWHNLQKSFHDIDLNIKQKQDTHKLLLVRYNELDRTLDELNNFVKSIRTLQQQSNDDIEQFLLLCQNKNRELTQHRTELQRVRQAITDISPDLNFEDTRQLIQKLNLLEIQWTDAERVLTNLIDSLSRRRLGYQEFEHKFVRFIQWFEHFLNNEFNQRLDGLTLSASLDILKNDIRQIVDDKRRQINELLLQARLLQTQTTDSIQLQTIKQKIDQLEQMILTTEQHVEKRIKKTEMILKMVHDFEEGYENIRIWLDTIETNLQRPISTQNSIENDIEKHTSTVTNLLALGRNILTETEIRPRNLDSIARSIQTLDERWIALKDLSRKRKVDINDIHTSWRNVDEMLKYASKMITDHERFLVEVKRANSSDGVQGIRNECKSLENFKRTLENDEKILQQIANSYSDVLRIYPTADVNGEIKDRIKEINLRWETLNATFNESLKHLKYMLSVHGDFQLTQDSLAVWLADLDVLLTNLEHLSEASTNEKLRQLDNMDREIEEKQSKIEYVQTCANYLLNQTVDARGLTINMNELSKFCQQLKNLSKRIKKLKQTLLNSNDRRSRSLHSRERYIRSYDNIEFGEQRQRADQLIADFEDLILQINGDFRSKEDNLHVTTPVGVQLESLPADFTYNRTLLSTRRKVDVLRDLIQQIKQELGSFFNQDLNNDSTVIDIMTKWSHLQTLANEKDEQLNQNRQQWKDFKRQLDDLELAAQQFTNLEQFLSRTKSSKSDVHQQLDEFQNLLKSTIELAEEFADDSNEWLLIEHRLRSIKDKFQFLFTKTSRPQRELKTNSDIKNELIEINTQLDHLESLTQSLEPVDENEMNQNFNRTKLHRFIRIHDDLEILNERLININDRISIFSSNEQMRITNDLRLIFDRLNTIRRIVRIYLDQLEKLLAKYENYSLKSSKTTHLQRVYQ